MVDRYVKTSWLDELFGFGTTEKVEDFFDDVKEFGRSVIESAKEDFPKISSEKTDAIKNGWKDFWEKFWGDTFDKDGIFGGGNNGNSDDYKEKDEVTSNAKERANEARNYIITFTKPKTFNEWLGDLGLSRDENSENYFGSYFKSATNALISSAYSDKEYNVSLAGKNRFENNLAAGSAYAKSQSDFNSKAQSLYKKGLKNSGFDSYLKGIAYLGYRDEIAKNNAEYEKSVREYNKAYSEKESSLKAEMHDKIAEREKELVKLYSDELSDNKKAITSIA